MAEFCQQNYLHPVSPTLNRWVKTIKLLMMNLPEECKKGHYYFRMASLILLVNIFSPHPI